MTKDSFVDIHLAIMDEEQDIAIALLSDLPFTGITQNYDEIVITLKKQDWAPETESLVRELLEPALGQVAIHAGNEIYDKNWNEEWEKKVPAIHVSENIGIAPEWKLDELHEPVKLIINPKMSFGTGEHNTTRLVCRLMEKVARPGQAWVDAGTGTGVLAVLAVKLGAGSCFAFDNNYWSIENARENFALNGVEDKIELDELDIETEELCKADCIAANLFTHLIISSLPKFHSSLKESGGDLVCSGILKYDRDRVIAEAEKAGFALVEDMTEDEWIAFHFRAA